MFNKSLDTCPVEEYKRPMTNTKQQLALEASSLAQQIGRLQDAADEGHWTHPAMDRRAQRLCAIAAEFGITAEPDFIDRESALRLVADINATGAVMTTTTETLAICTLYAAAAVVWLFGVVEPLMSAVLS